MKPRRYPGIALFFLGACSACFATGLVLALVGNESLGSTLGLAVVILGLISMCITSISGMRRMRGQ